MASYPINVAAAFNASKEAILNLMRSRHCADVAYVDEQAQSFSKLVPLLLEFAKTFDCDPAYLVTILGQIPSEVLLDQRVYLNPALPAGEVENAAFVVGGVIEQVTINGATAGVYHTGLEVHNNANISKILVKGNMRVKNITIASGSQVDELEIEAGSVVESITLKCCLEDNCGKLLKLYGDGVEDLTIDPFAQFGGKFCKPQTILP